MQKGTNLMSEEKKIAIVAQPANIRTIYSNGVRVDSTEQEIFLTFGVDTGQIRPSNNPDIDGTLNFWIQDYIAMSPRTAKRLAGMLTQVLNKYEARFGVIEDGKKQPQAE